MIRTELYGMHIDTVVKEFNTVDEVIKYITSTGYPVSEEMKQYIDDLEIRYPNEYKAMKIKRM